MDLYAELVGRALFPLWETTLRGRPTLSLLRYLEQTQMRSREEIEALQLGALRRLLEHAHANVPFYRQRLADARVRPVDVRSIADLQRLPLLERAEVRAAGSTRASVAGPRVAITKTTTGSSGEPLSIGYDRGSESWRQATRLRGYGWAGHHVGTRTVHYWGRQPPPPLLRRAKVAADHFVRRERIIDCGARSEVDLEAVVQELRRDPPEVLVCFSQGGADLARYVNARRARHWPDLNVICAAERLLPSDRAAIVEAFGPKVFETYGSREVMLVASECEAHDGLHVSMENLIVELVVRDGGGERPAKEGETGEVVVTDLHNYGMPFIRYAMGDLAVARGRQPCRCGRQLDKIASIDGRVMETVIAADGGRVSALVFIIAIGERGRLCKSFQVVQHRDRSVTVRIASERLSVDVERDLRAAIEPYLRGLPLRFERVDDLPLDASGKRRQVIVEREA